MTSPDLLPVTADRATQENFRRILQLLREILARLDALDGGGP